MDDIFEIEQLAYHLWEKAGYPDGRDQDFWYEAEKTIRERYGKKDVWLATVSRSFQSSDDNIINEGVQIQLNTERTANLDCQE